MLPFMCVVSPPVGGGNNDNVDKETDEQITHTSRFEGGVFLFSRSNQCIVFEVSGT